MPTGAPATGLGGTADGDSNLPLVAGGLLALITALALSVVVLERRRG
ncbi:hypothetical protein [Sporichthya polymorpha]|nr:hypothetical protein [Sporichthya polymorpha]